jgi:hypothetical protein
MGLIQVEIYCPLTVKVVNVFYSNWKDEPITQAVFAQSVKFEMLLLIFVFS